MQGSALRLSRPFTAPHPAYGRNRTAPPVPPPPRRQDRDTNRLTHGQGGQRPVGLYSGTPGMEPEIGFHGRGLSLGL